ncbi:hypothetical protein DL769_001902 [Monosporascus sp. CRB-8-3]|nr:hypothetical protein DL769_001902 [Monosporascus sp. CRB-8-3]
MEPVGLAVGITGLAGLFSVCLDVIDKVDSYRDYGVDSRSITAQFEAEKHLFKIWARDVGFENRNLKDNHHERLDSPDTRAIVEKLLASINEIFSQSESHVSNLAPKNQNKIQKDDAIISKKDRIGWTLRGKQRFTAQVQQFGALVQKLYSLVPPNSPGDGVNANTGPQRADRGSLNDEWFANSQRILIEMQKRIENDARKELEIWLDASWNNDLYDNFVRRRLNGTCKWILNRTAFLDWVSPEFPTATAKMLWINGPAGYGKTVLCASLVEHLSTTFGSGVAFYFFSSESESRGDPFAIIRSWVCQLISRDRNAFELACARWDTKSGPTATRSEVLELFKVFLNTAASCTFIVDGLDECVRPTESSKSNYDDSVYGVLKTIGQATAHSNTRILIVSRPDADIRSGFYSISETDPNVKLYEYKMSPDDVRSDAIQFSRSIVDRKLAKKDEKLRDDLAYRIADRCEGMFLWVKVLENQLRGAKNRKQLEDIVDHTPTELNRLYDRNWAQISSLPDSDRSRAFSILRWTAFALRPLTVAELAEALLVVDDDTCADLLVEEFPDAIDEEFIDTEILGLCGSLLECRSTGAKQPLASMTVQPIHFSVKQYILCNISVPGLLVANKQLRDFNEAIQNNVLARLCLRYLNYQAVWQGFGQKHNPPEEHPFRDYAASAWYHHIYARTSAHLDVDRLVNKFFQPGNKKWEAWKKWFDDAEWGSHPHMDIPDASPLYYASKLGLQGTVIHLTEVAKIEVNHRDSGNRTALQAACAQNHISIARLLLEKGADVTVSDTNKQTPLNLASINGNVEVVKLLLEKGADIMVADSDGWTPLNSASNSGHVEVVKLLLEKGANVTVASTNRWTPLNTASYRGHLEIVKLLLEKRADVTAANAGGSTPLYSASRNGHLEIVKILLENGAGVTIGPHHGWTPLNIASNNGHLEIVKLLVEKGADVTVADIEKWTPLHSASENGHVEIIKLLLEEGADVTVSNANGWTPLHLASYNGHAEVVKLLLKEGADVTVATALGWAPLHSASCNGHVEIVKLLLEKGADITAADIDRGTPLNAASENGHVEVVKLLLEKGADVTVADGYGGPPLISASSGGHIEVVKLLLENGADPNSKDNIGRTPLSFASKNGYSRIVMMLCADERIDPDPKDHYGSTPLSIAARNGNVEAASLLLATGRVDLESRDVFGRTPLWYARRYDKTAMVQLLLDSAENMGILVCESDVPTKMRNL